MTPQAFAASDHVLRASAVDRFGTDAQRERYLPRLCSGQWIGAHGMSEPDSGSDAFALRTTAIRDGDAYWKVQLTSYYGETGDSRQVTFRYDRLQ